jgi:SAM-dependent methyltransferase
MKKRRQKKNSQEFWNKEYKTGEHLALSTNHSEDLAKFMRWLERNGEKYSYHPVESALDLGCGNGRNLIFLAASYGLAGTGIDISAEAIAQAKAHSGEHSINYHVQSIAEPIPLEDDSQSLVIDMMTSHFLNQKQRTHLLSEVVRVLKPGGWLYFKTFLLDEDRHAKRLLEESPAEEAGSYIHPEIGVAEHVFTEREIHELLDDEFFIHKITKSHKHKMRGKAAKRRSISVYAQKAG